MVSSEAEKQVRSILTDIEAEKARQFADDVQLREVVRKVLLMALYENGTIKAGVNAQPGQNWALNMVATNKEATNEELGADLRATWEGIIALQNGLEKFDVFKTAPKKEETTKNKAR